MISTEQPQDKLDEASEYEVENQSEEDSQNDYKIEPDKTPNTKKDLYNDESSDEDKNLATNMEGTESLNTNAKKRIRKQIDKMRRMKAKHRRQLLKDAGELPKKKSVKKDAKKDAKMINDITRKATQELIENYLWKIDRFQATKDLIPSYIIKLEEIIFERAGEKADAVYLKIAKTLYSNLNTLKTCSWVNLMIVKGELPLTKLFTNTEKFQQKCKILQDKFNGLMNVQVVLEPKCQEIDKSEKDERIDPNLVKLKSEYEKLRLQNQNEVDKWMVNANVDKDSVTQTKMRYEQSVAQQKEELKKLGNPYGDSSDEESTKSDHQDEDISHSSEKFEISKKGSSLKNCLQTLRKKKNQK